MCCLHGEDEEANSEAKILLFNETSIRTCRRILETRKEQKLKYANIIIPVDIGETEGYTLTAIGSLWHCLKSNVK